MTQEDKNLLLKDLCARLPYGVIVRVEDASDFDGEIEPYDTRLSLGLLENFIGHSFTLKPYLRPMSSMMEEEENELVTICVRGSYKDSVFKSYLVNDWLNAHHFDYRGLIRKGLALKAPKGMYN